MIKDEGKRNGMEDKMYRGTGLDAATGKGKIIAPPHRLLDLA